MRFDRGWVKSYRLPFDHWLSQDLFAKAVLDILVQWANIEDSPPNSKIQLKRGQVATSSLELSNGFGVGRQRVRGALAKLEHRGVINQQSNQHGTVITILKYDHYQPKKKEATNDPTIEQPTDNQRITNEQPLIKELKNLRTEELKCVAPAEADEVLRAYAEGYQERYNATPLISTAKRIDQAMELIRAIGLDAIQVARFYPLWNKQFFVDNRHDFGLLVKNIEEVHDRWIAWKKSLGGMNGEKEA